MQSIDFTKMWLLDFNFYFWQREGVPQYSICSNVKLRKAGVLARIPCRIPTSSTGKMVPKIFCED